MVINKLLIKYRKWKIRREVAKENLIKCSQVASNYFQNRKSWNTCYPPSLQEMCEGSLIENIQKYQHNMQEENKARMHAREIRIDLQRRFKE